MSAPGWPRLRGGVYVEPALASRLLALLDPGRRKLRADGLELPEPMRRLVAALEEEAAAQQPDGGRPLPAVTWIASSEAASRLGLKSAQAVRDMVRDGRLVGRKDGRRMFVEAGSVESAVSMRALSGFAKEPQVTGRSQSFAKSKVE